ncbi:MAG: cytochrome c oxidase subunit 3 [Gemmatimonadetes bacterium]|nr:cytochrome c oxidase subunit 3 [Gemmatimonadota bacterium]
MIQSTVVPPGPFRVGQEPADGPYPMGLMVILATVTMLFAAFIAALLMRRSGSDWVPIHLPSILWVNTALLVFSSVAVEGARTAISADRTGATLARLAGGTALGVLFVAGQIVAWRELALQGVFLRSGPYSAFFYVLSILHALHISAGLGALTWTLRRAHAGAYSAARHAGLTHAAVFWHFLGATWICLFAVLLVF